MEFTPVIPVRCDGRCGGEIHVDCEAVDTLWKFPDVPEYMARHHGWLILPNGRCYCAECRNVLFEEKP